MSAIRGNLFAGFVVYSGLSTGRVEKSGVPVIRSAVPRLPRPCRIARPRFDKGQQQDREDQFDIGRTLHYNVSLMKCASPFFLGGGVFDRTDLQSRKFVSETHARF